MILNMLCHYVPVPVYLHVPVQGLSQAGPLRQSRTAIEIVP